MNNCILLSVSNLFTGEIYQDLDTDDSGLMGLLWGRWFYKIGFLGFTLLQWKMVIWDIADWSLWEVVILYETGFGLLEFNVSLSQ